ncbi:MAG: SDR family oxidoreductase [Cyanobacteria bacterium P01_H01_bin.21]
MKLENKKVVVIGGSSGIGLAIAKEAASAKAKVVIASRSPQHLEEALAEIEENILIYPVDIENKASLQDFFQREGVVDHLVITAGAVKMGNFIDMSVEDAIASMNSKFFGAYRALKTSTVCAGGSITLISGTLSRRPTKGTVVAAAINAAIEGLGRALAIELAPVRVNVISPGLIETPLYDDLPADKREELYQSKVDSLPVGRAGCSEDVSSVAMMLMTNGYTTGTVVDVDGGSQLV